MTIHVAQKRTRWISIIEGLGLSSYTDYVRHRNRATQTLQALLPSSLKFLRETSCTVHIADASFFIARTRHDAAHKWTL